MAGVRKTFQTLPQHSIGPIVLQLLRQKEVRLRSERQGRLRRNECATDAGDDSEMQRMSQSNMLAVFFSFSFFYFSLFFFVFFPLVRSFSLIRAIDPVCGCAGVFWVLTRSVCWLYSLITHS
jgi:hypothetical protein